MSFSIVIPTKNPTNLSACVSAIRKSGETARIIVVIDASDLDSPSVDNILDMGAMTMPFSAMGDILIRFADGPFCFSRSINIGIRAAQQDDVILMNDDALLLNPDGNEDAGLGALSLAAQYATYQGGIPWGVVSAGVSGHPNAAFPMNSQRVAQMYSLLARSLWPIRTAVHGMVPFVCVYIARTTLERVGLLDERFCGEINGIEVYGGEDDDFCWRARQHGYRIGIYDGCVVDHKTLPSTFRPDGKGRSIDGARARFLEIHGFQMGSR